MFRAWYRVFDYNGRSSRWEYWSFNIGVAILLVVFMVGLQNTTAAELQRETGGDPAVISLSIIVVALAIVLPALSLRVRRIHDFGSSGWLILLTLVPVANLILEIMLLFRGTKPDPEPVYYAAPAADPQPIQIYNSTHATSAETVNSQTVHVHQIEKLADMHTRGLLTADEFAAAKQKILSAN